MFPTAHLLSNKLVSRGVASLGISRKMVVHGGPKLVENCQKVLWHKPSTWRNSYIKTRTKIQNWALFSPHAVTGTFIFSIFISIKYNAYGTNLTFIVLPLAIIDYTGINLSILNFSYDYHWKKYIPLYATLNLELNKDLTLNVIKSRLNCQMCATIYYD